MMKVLKQLFKWTFILSTLVLIVGGLGLVGLDKYRGNQIKNIQAMKVDEFKSASPKINNQVDSRESVGEELSKRMDYASVDIPTVDEVIKANKPENKDKVKKLVAGQMYIPKLNLTLNIIEGTNRTNMLYGVTTMLPNQRMGEGNYVLAGHNMKLKGVLLSDIIWNDVPRVHKGDKIQLYDGKKYYNYVIESTKTVHKSDTSCLEETYEPTLTLFTCTKDTNNSGTTPYRFVVTAKLVK